MTQKKEGALALVKESDLSLAGANNLNKEQLAIILKKTPEKYIHKRPAKGGGQWSYVTGGYIKKCLNLMFGWDWDFEIVDQEIMIEAGEVVVKGKLTCRSGGNTIVKMQFGNKEIAFKTKYEGSKKIKTKEPLSIGNDMKAAATDCLKKCAAELGIAADIYNADDFNEIKVVSDDQDHIIEKIKSFTDAEELMAWVVDQTELHGDKEFEALVQGQKEKLEKGGES